MRALARQLPCPANVWQGVSVENASHIWRIADLQTVPAAVRFLSIEPLSAPQSVVVAALVIGLFCTCSAVISLILSFEPRAVRLVATRRERQRIEAELEYLQPRERQIIGCLLVRRQRMIEVQPEGEQAASLIAKGFLVLPARRPLAIYRDVAFEIPAHVWDVLIKHTDMFPYNENSDAPNPWRTHWMAR